MINRSQHRKAILLVVDPNPISLSVVAGVMDTQGYECYCARTPEAAGKAVAQAPIDLILWDVTDDAAAAIAHMQALRKSASERMADVPLIVLAESCWAGLETRLDQIAPARCLFKPLDPNTLIDLVQQVLWVPHVIGGHHMGSKRPQRPDWVRL